MTHLSRIYTYQCVGDILLAYYTFTILAQLRGRRNQTYENIQFAVATEIKGCLVFCDLQIVRKEMDWLIGLYTENVLNGSLIKPASVSHKRSHVQPSKARRFCSNETIEVEVDVIGNALFESRHPEEYIDEKLMDYFPLSPLLSIVVVNLSHAQFESTSGHFQHCIYCQCSI